MNKHEFKNLFTPLPGGFSEPTEFTDDVFGFSITKEYPNGYASLFKIYIKKEELLKEEPQKVVCGTVTYGKKTSDGIIISSSSEKIKRLFDPLDIQSVDEFFYNSATQEFFFGTKKISAQEVVMILDKLHIKITKNIQGTWLRLKIIWFHYLLTALWQVIFHMVSGVQYLATGEKIKIFQDVKDSSKSIYLDEKPLSIKESDLIDLWGYKVKPWIAGTYAMIHLIIYVVFFKYDYKPLWLTTLFKNSFLTFMYGIASLGLANTFLPILFRPVQLRRILKFIQNRYMSAAYMKVSI